MHQVFTAKGTEGTFHKEGNVNVLTIVSGQPIGETECASEAKKLAKAWVLDHPDDTVYLAEDRRVLEWIRNTAVDRWKGYYYQHSAIYISHIIFLITYIVAQLFHDYGAIGVASILVVAALYQLLWRLRIQNEIESAVVMQMAYLLFLISIPIFSR